ncbi:hypothetical protein Nepgr_020390 [Nepenthes gracilis]|uniref:Uncharacterized protein n=1 Tax=Nepenthes gracilis TaxID=150966 RepID=A0AAD3SWV7_NEPGR|nr:hypothetical protein Nepgr_020390 [Nepenthes gracilis]
MEFCPMGKTWVAPHSRVPQLSPKRTLPKDFPLSAQGDASEMSSSNKFVVLQSEEIIKATGQRSIHALIRDQVPLRSSLQHEDIPEGSTGSDVECRKHKQPHSSSLQVLSYKVELNSPPTGLIAHFGNVDNADDELPHSVAFAGIVKACPVVGCESHSAAEVSSDGALVLWLRCTCLMFHGHCGDIGYGLACIGLICICLPKCRFGFGAHMSIPNARFGLVEDGRVPGCGWMGLAKVDGDALMWLLSGSV